MDPASVARSLTSALANPYSYSHSVPHSPRQHVNTHGYSYSSTYNPSSHSSTPSFTNRPSRGPSASAGRSFPPRGAPPTHWYTPGNSKCTYLGCTFTGSVKSVQIHMMDRHLIYPPGWYARKRQSDWDADPSLKGKPIPILGTNVRLDTPEEIAAWIAERKRRWPTDTRTAEKKRKLEDAMANGQLHPDHLALMGNKRFKSFSSDPEVAVTRTGRGRGGRPFGFGGRSRGRGAYSRNLVHERSAVPDGIASSSAQTLPSSRRPAVKDTGIPRPPSVPNAPSARDADVDVALHPGSDDNGDDDDDDNDAAPEEVSAKRPNGIVAYGSSSDAELEKPHAANIHSQPGPITSSSSCTRPANAAASQPSILAKAESANRSRRAPPPQPKMPPRNPFAARPSLLRNLLQPEIRMTVSNLSQAIHFLVENDFLENVELKPGEANEKRIEVVGEQTAELEAGMEHAGLPQPGNR